MAAQSRTLRNSMISLAIFLVIVVVLLISVPGLRSAADRISDADPAWVGVAVVFEVFRAKPFVLLCVDEPQYLARDPAGLVQVERLQHLAQNARLIVGVQYLEALRQACLAPMQTQQPVRETVKGSDPERAAWMSQ